MIYILGAALLFMILTTAVLLRNRFEFKSIADQSLLNVANQPKVSICVPARNEENVIEKCVKSLIDQTYENKEILVLDDNSTDTTPDILKHLSSSSDQLKIINGKPKPEDWLGKPWACHQLSQKASGDILVFIDADVWLEPDTISKATCKLSNIDALTVWPQQRVHGFLEKLIVPTIYFALLTLLPATYVERSPRWMPGFLKSFLNPKFVAACGQFIAFNKSAYNGINGHQGVKEAVVEDMELARNLKNNGFTLSMMNGINSVYCRMYTSGSEIWQGLQKNFLAGFGSSFEFIFMGILHLLFFVFPFFTLVIGYLNNDQILLGLSILIILLYIFQRLILNIWFKWNWWMAIFHPFAIIWYQLLGLKCILNRIFGWKSSWKGRPV